MCYIINSIRLSRVPARTSTENFPPLLSVLLAASFSVVSSSSVFMRWLLIHEATSLPYICSDDCNIISNDLIAVVTSNSHLLCCYFICNRCVKFIIRVVFFIYDEFKTNVSHHTYVCNINLPWRIVLVAVWQRINSLIIPHLPLNPLEMFHSNNCKYYV